MALAQGNSNEAQALQDEALALCRKLHTRPKVEAVLARLGAVTLLQGDPASAHTCYLESLAVCLTEDNRPLMAKVLAGLAGCAAPLHTDEQPTTDRARDAVVLLGAVAAFLSATGIVLPSYVRTIDERARSTTRLVLDETVYQAAWSEGQALPLEQAAEYALRSV